MLTQQQKKQKIKAIVRQYQQDKDVIEQSYKNLSQINYSKALRQITKIYPDIIHKISDDLQNLPFAIQSPQHFSDFSPRNIVKQSLMSDLDEQQQYHQTKQQPHDKFSAKKSSKKESKNETKSKKDKKKISNDPEFQKGFAGQQNVDVKCFICQKQGYLISDGCKPYYHPQCLKCPKLAWQCDQSYGLAAYIQSSKQISQ